MLLKPCSARNTGAALLVLAVVSNNALRNAYESMWGQELNPGWEHAPELLYSWHLDEQDFTETSGKWDQVGEKNSS